MGCEVISELSPSHPRRHSCVCITTHLFCRSLLGGCDCDKPCISDPDSRVISVNYVLHNSLSEIDSHSRKVSYMSCVSAGLIMCTSCGECVGNDSQRSYFTGARAPDNP